MLRRLVKPSGVALVDQVEPPSVLTNRDAPTAMQSVLEGQATASMAFVPEGTVVLCHVAPPSLDRTTTPEYGENWWLVRPAARHAVTDVHAAPTNVVLATGS